MTTIILKIGGEIVEHKKILQNILKDIKELSSIGLKIILVHGGGPQADALAIKMGHNSKKINGRRITTEKDLEIVKMLYGGSLNLEILSIMKKLNIKGMRVSGLDGDLLNVKVRKKTEVDYGFVGDITAVNPEILFHLLEKNIIPIISPIAVTKNGTILNINADTIAMKIAAKIKADKLIIFSNTNGIYKNSITIPFLNKKTAKNLIKDKIVKDGMLVKLENCIQALKEGVNEVHIINGLSKACLLKKLFTTKGIGTTLKA